MAHQNDNYQWKLRSLGAYLDERKAVAVSLIETTEGFAVRYFTDANEQRAVFEQVNETQLRAFQVALTQRRTGSGAAAKDTDRYQDFLRALGWELDDSGATNIVLDELDAAFFLTYLNPDSPGTPRSKRLANLGPGEKHAILRDAKGRRRAVRSEETETADPT